MKSRVRILKCRLGLHGSGIVGSPSPGPSSTRSCLRCGKAWIGAYDGVEPHWKRVW